MKIKVFYSYSHKDEDFKNALETHFAVLRNDNLIDEWHDGKINAGDDWNKEIQKNMDDAHIILLLFSPDFIDSDACQKEVKRALELKKEKGTIFIPVILRPCSWEELDDIFNIQALPKDKNPVSKWDNNDEAWQNVYEGIKSRIEKMKDTMPPKLKDEFRKDLLHNPTQNSTLDELFVYPDILENNVNTQLENREIDSKKLKNIDSFEHKYILIEGEEQIGKTSLCNMLYIQYSDANFYPVLINGMDIVGKSNIKKIVDKTCDKQYERIRNYWSIDKEKRILLIDDIEERKSNDEHFSEFIASVKEYFDYAVVFVDNLSSLSDKTTSQNHFSYFHNFSICSLGHKKRNELIKKCISYDEKTEFDTKNMEHVKKLDKDTKHIDTIIGTNVVPSYPVFVVTVFHAIETLTPQDFSQTSYGHCYQAMITMSFSRAGIENEDIDAYFNLLTELAYSMFNQKNKKILEEDLNNFLTEYKNKFVMQENPIQTLIKANIIKKNNDSYDFQYIYIYYYFVAKYIARKIDDSTVKKEITKLIKDIHLKDNANIVIFITHHMQNKDLLEDIVLYTMSAFEEFPEATLSGDEKNFINPLSNHLQERRLPDANHNVENQRSRELEERDRSDSAATKDTEDDEDQNDDPTIIEIRKSAKSIEIIGQILKNQYGSTNRNTLRELFEAGQNVGLRLLKSFMKLIEDDRAAFEYIIQLKLEQQAEEKNMELSTEEIEKGSKKIIYQLSYSVIFGWLHKITDSLGYNRLIQIADDVNDRNKSVASRLINLYIHTWYTKKLNFDKIKSIYKELKDDKNYQAIYILKDIVCRHIYMHPINFKDKQRIGQLLDLSVQRQVVAQQKLEKK